MDLQVVMFLLASASASVSQREEPRGASDNAIGSLVWPKSGQSPGLLAGVKRQVCTPSSCALHSHHM
eukprot:668876-Pelagomonas_calceolata.AAC.2